MLEDQAGILDPVDHGAGLALPHLRLQEVGEGVESIDPGRELAEALEVVHEHRERGQEHGERTGGLDHAPDLELAGDDPRSDDHAGQDDGDEAVSVLEQAQAQRPLDELVEIDEHLGETSRHPQRFLGFPAVKGDGFCVLADANQAEAEIRLSSKQLEIEPDQRFREHQERDRRAGDGIDHQDQDQPPGNGPQNPAEGDQLQDRADRNQQEGERLLGERVDVFRDALVGVVDVAVRGEFVEGPVGEILPQDLARHPAPPANGELVPDEVVERIDRDGEDQQADEDVDRVPEPAGVPFRQRGREFSRLLVEEYGESGLPQQQPDQERE